MATDIAPALYEAIKAEFDKAIANDAQIVSVSNRIRDGTATLVDAHKYAERVGEILSEALQNNLTEIALPGGKLYWNIADRTIKPMLANNHGLINSVAAEIQKALDTAQGLDINAVSGELLTGRINGLISKATEKNLVFEEMQTWLGEPIVNISEAFFDEFVKENAEFRAKAGMESKIIRVAAPGCCEWCNELVGSYNYKDLDNGSDVYRRHEFCRCTLTFQSGRLLQNAWTKRIYDSVTKEAIQERRTKNIELYKRTPQEAAIVERAFAAERNRRR